MLPGAARARWLRVSHFAKEPSSKLFARDLSSRFFSSERLSFKAHLRILYMPGCKFGLEPLSFISFTPGIQAMMGAQKKRSRRNRVAERFDSFIDGKVNWEEKILFSALEKPVIAQHMVSSQIGWFLCTQSPLRGSCIVRGCNNTLCSLHRCPPLDEMYLPTSALPRLTALRCNPNPDQTPITLDEMYLLGKNPTEGTKLMMAKARGGTQGQQGVERGTGTME